MLNNLVEIKDNATRAFLERSNPEIAEALQGGNDADDVATELTN